VAPWELPAVSAVEGEQVENRAVANDDQSSTTNRRESEGSSRSNVQHRENPDDWVSGDDAMTGAQASYLKTLSEQVHKPEAFDSSLTKADASKRIDALKARLAKD
jgi:hypothetical protein